MPKVFESTKLTLIFSDEPEAATPALRCCGVTGLDMAKIHNTICNVQLSTHKRFSICVYQALRHTCKRIHNTFTSMLMLLMATLQCNAMATTTFDCTTMTAVAAAAWSYQRSLDEMTPEAARSTKQTRVQTKTKTNSTKRLAKQNAEKCYGNGS